jgi:ubiquinol-cytochrome c reductase cytochrome b/c1 subunit
MRKTRLLLIAATALLGVASANAAEGHIVIQRQPWSFAGPFGTFDRGQIQRGYRIYKEVCAACHGMKLVAFRNLAQPGGPGFTEAQAKTVAAEYKITDGPNDKGEMFERPGRLSDYFPSPDPNEQAARARFNGAHPPDLSVIAKARGVEAGLPRGLFDIITQYQEGGPDYIYALLTGYGKAPAGETMTDTQHWNNAFPGHKISMPPPLTDGQIDYTDGTPATVDQYARDVSAFLMWAAEPHMEARKRIGFQVMIFLLVFATLAYYTKKKVWADLH